MEGETEDEIVAWFHNTTDADSRQKLLCRIFNVLPDDQLKRTQNNLNRCKQDRKRKELEAQGVTLRPKKARGSGPAQLLPEPLPLAHSGWLSSYKKSDVVAIDVEKVGVKLPNSTTKKRFESKAAIISVVDGNGDEIYKSKISYEFGSYHVTPKSTEINGITSTTLQANDCENKDSAYKRLEAILKDKLIVAIELEQDFNSMDLIVGLYDTFDLQKHFYRLSYSTRGKRIEEKLSLRSLVWHYFNVDMQPQGEIHTPTNDAKWTMRIFLECYCKVDPLPLTKDCNYDGTNFIQHFN